MSNHPSLERITGSNVVIVAGKGGVGKTTVTAVLARAAADAGQRVLAVELDAKPMLSELLDGRADVLGLDAGEALREYLLDNGFGRVARRFINSGTIDMVSTATPGLADVVTLGKIKQLEQAGDYDLIVVDGPAAGHAVTFLTSAAGLLDAVRGGPVHRQAREVNALLSDPQRCSVTLVTMPETTPVNELIETAFFVEDRAGVALSSIIVNQVAEEYDLEGWDTLDLSAPCAAAVADAARFTADRMTIQRRELARLDRELPLGQLRLSTLSTASLDATDIGRLASEAFDDHSTAADESTATPSTDAVAAFTSDNPLPRLLDTAAMLICTGSGGVGKTTTAATLGIEAAHRGRRAVVVTIDPARRLADALGVPGGLSGDPAPVPVAGSASGEMWAMMLDTPALLEILVREHAGDEEQAQRIASNRFFVNMSKNLSGTQEYMASEALYRLHNDERFDLVIVDTPPSRNALDFLESPGLLSRFLQHPVFKVMMLPTRTGFKMAGSASQLVLGRIGKIIGSDALADAVAFFQAFAGMETGFQARAEAVSELIADDSTHFVVVGAPQRDTVAEAAWFAGQLRDHGYSVSAAIVNRLSPDFVAEHGCNGVPAGDHAAIANLRRLDELARAQRRVVGELTDRVDRNVVVPVPLLATDVHDVAALEMMRDHLMRIR